MSTCVKDQISVNDAGEGYPSTERLWSLCPWRRSKSQRDVALSILALVGDWTGQFQDVPCQFSQSVIVQRAPRDALHCQDLLLLGHGWLRQGQ